MSTSPIKSNNLPPLQKAIVLHLAKNEPQTINETNTALSKSYKPTWVAFNSLEEKKLIVKATQKNYRGQNYPSFWLTDPGIIMAIMEGANPEELLEQAKILYPDNKILLGFLEVTPFFHPKVMALIFTTVKERGKLGFTEVATFYVSQASIGMDIETAKKVVQVLKKYPEQYEKLKIAVQAMIEQLSLLIAE